MNSVIIDTNGFLRLLLNDIPSQADQVEEYIKKAKKEHIKIIVPVIILFEISFVLSKYYNIEKKEIIEKLKSLISTPYFLIESKAIFSKALTIYESANIDLVDSFLLSKVEIEKAEIFTFDKKLKKS